MNFQIENIKSNSGNPILFRHKFHMCSYHLAGLLLEPLIEMESGVEISKESVKLKLIKHMWCRQTLGISKFETLQPFSVHPPQDLGPFSQLFCHPVSCRWELQPARGVPGTENEWMESPLGQYLDGQIGICLKLPWVNYLAFMWDVPVSSSGCWPSSWTSASSSASSQPACQLSLQGELAGRCWSHINNWKVV